MTFSTLRLTQDGGVATITLARPDKLNALTAAMHADLREALEICERDDEVRVIVLTGEGRAFSSGQDLTEDLPRDAEGRIDLGPPLARDYNPLVRRLAEFPKVTVAALNGPAVGASDEHRARLRPRRGGALGLFARGVRPHRARPGCRRHLDPAPTRRAEAGARPHADGRARFRR